MNCKHGVAFSNSRTGCRGLAVCVLAAVYAYFKVSFNYWKKRDVPYAKPTFPFGNFGDKIFLEELWVM